MKRLLCLLFGHRWANVRAICHWSLVLTHLHPLAGCAATCSRCGKEWHDTCGGSSPNWTGCAQ